MFKDYEQYVGTSGWTVDIWTGVGNNEFAGYTAHWIDSDFNLHRAALDMSFFPEQHTGVNIHDKLTDLMDRFGSKPFHITTDRGANVRLGVNLFLGHDGALGQLLTFELRVDQGRTSLPSSLHRRHRSKSTEHGFSWW